MLARARHLIYFNLMNVEYRRELGNFGRRAGLWALGTLAIVFAVETTHGSKEQYDYAINCVREHQEWQRGVDRCLEDMPNEGHSPLLPGLIELSAFGGVAAEMLHRTRQKDAMNSSMMAQQDDYDKV